jgi:hypothetical protein
MFNLFLLLYKSLTTEAKTKTETGRSWMLSVKNQNDAIVCTVDEVFFAALSIC